MEEKESFEEFGKKMKEALDIDFYTAIDDAIKGAQKLNNVFGQSRERVTELMQAVSFTIPGIRALGGEITDVFETLEQVSKATRRNIVASADDASKLFAAYKILDEDVQTIVETFEEVGVQFSQIGPQLEKSINYVQNLGLNVKQIMGDVSRNMSKINEYNFAGGVEGLTKMAAHASLFKFDMSETFKIAEKALRPDGAIELASAFQRMGVAVGELTDPFQLMNMSLNDPEGLERSLAKIGKQYTEFDEKTKTFKINPAGMLQMRELAEQTGLNYQNLAKSALASANLDKALSQIQPGISFDKPEDRELLASLATMNTKGDYVVNLKKPGGEDQMVELSKLSNEQQKEFLEQQKKAPKTLEDIAKAQLGTEELILAETKAMVAKVTGPVAASKQVRGTVADISEFTRFAMTTIQKALPDVDKSQVGVEKGISSITTILAELSTGNLKGDKATSAIKNLEEQIDSLGKAAGEKATEAFKEIKIKGEALISSAKTGYLNTSGVIPESKKSAASTTSVKESKVDLGGTITIKVDGQSGMNKTDLERVLNSTEFKQKIYQYIKDIELEKEKTKRNSP
jgi:ElaB/YqjD/DUF883 family membrane-anchored ribosome-binding protein